MKLFDKSIAAVVVTYNRKNLLIACLAGLVKQTKSLSTIFIIDNFSNDETHQLLYKEGFIDKTPPIQSSRPWIAKSFYNPSPGSKIKLQAIEIIYVRMFKNTGGAGGFYEGVRRAHLSGFDWVWLMDDDVSPDKNCLSTLIQEAKDSKCIHPSRCNENGSIYLWNHTFEPITGIGFNFPYFEKGVKPNTYINYGCFEGMLIHKDVIDQIGYPPKNYFICADDTQYGFKASLITNVKYTKLAKMKRLQEGITETAAWKVYYIIRNRIWLFKDVIQILNFKKRKFFRLFQAMMIVFWLFLAIKWSFKNWRFLIPALKGYRDGLMYNSKEKEFFN